MQLEFALMLYPFNDTSKESTHAISLLNASCHC